MTALKLRPDGGSLSDYDIMVLRLENWGRSARQLMGPKRAGAGSIYFMGKKDNRAGVDIDGNLDNTYEERVYTNERDADELDGYIRQMYRPYRDCVREAFYLQKRTLGTVLATSIRHLCDLVDGNRLVNAKMRGL